MNVKHAAADRGGLSVAVKAGFEATLRARSAAWLHEFHLARATT